MGPTSSEFKIQEMLPKDPADIDEDLWKVPQQRANRRKQICLQVRKTAGRTVSPNITTKQNLMEIGVYAAIDLGEFNATGKAASWAAQNRAWLEMPATVERYLETLPELKFRHSAVSSSMPKPADE